MTRTNKTAVQAAVLIHEHLMASQPQDRPISLPDYSWGRLLQLRRQIGLAHAHGWQRAATRLTGDMAETLESCCRQLEIVRHPLQSSLAERHVSSPTAIYQDILALYEEFEEVKIDLKEDELSVTTDAIELEDIYLGAFEIRLDWQRLGGIAQPYRVVAIDPHPAARHEDVTHPHVQDEQLCEGEGRAAIAAALAECRLHDFFLLVSHVLHTYGRGSAYVELSDWFGATCTDCGATMSPDDSYCCERCGSELCDDCRQLCAGCEESHCSECLSQCPGCERDFCRSCMAMCPACKRSFCSGCLDKCAACGRDFCPSCLETCPVCQKQFCNGCLKEGGLCESCYEKQHNQEKEDDPPQKDTSKAPRGRSRASRRRRVDGASV
jgi:hypothetical protein